ncbi:MAG: DUF2806 domain-containing protein [Burkholderiales bacterium]|nr:DUF2806 domain-containing protein [Burkholderiales bacterium]MBI3728904.1 DUF2806 domain-containing protein [Burkholderiales bacterium]
MDKPLIELKALAVPLTKLVEVIARGMGNLYEPIGTVRNAKADAKAMQIRAEAKLIMSDIRDRAKNRLDHRELSRQENIEAITSKAIAELPDEVSSEPVNQDWITQFISRAQDVCDEDLQLIWARILAGEISRPNTYSKRTLQFLETLDKTEAEELTRLCSMLVKVEENRHILFSYREISTEIDTHVQRPRAIGHFTSLGLISTEERTVGNADVTGLQINYFDQIYEMNGPPKPEKRGPNMITPLQLPISFRELTAMGQQLASIANPERNTNFIETFKESMNQGYKVSIVQK